MTAALDDAWYMSVRPQQEPLTSEQYAEMPEDISRTIEVVDGYVVFCESPTREHQRAVRRLANVLETATADAPKSLGCLAVDMDVDLRVRDVPLLNLRPDVVLYRCLDADERLRPEHVLLVVEVVSPGSEARDTIDKFGEYAKAGIQHYWIVRLDDGGVSTIERYQLDRATSLYKHLDTAMKDEPGEPVIANPLPLTLRWAALAF